jgi:hypothetical protein
MNTFLEILKKIPLNSYKYLILSLIIFISGTFVGFKCNNKQQVIIKPSIEKIIDSVIIHDTTIIKQTIVKYKEKLDTIYLKDMSNRIYSKNDTTPCYTIEGTSDRGTYAKAEIRSKEFPKIIPIDISSDMIIREAPGTVKKIKIIDTLIYKTPWYKEKKNYYITGLITIIGGLLYWR